MQKLPLCLLLFSALNSAAQPYLSNGGDFSVDQRRGCRDLFITVTNIDPGLSNVILYQYEGRSSPVLAANTFTYTTAGDFWLYQYIQGATNQKVDSMLIQILEPTIPYFELQSCNNRDVQLIINNTDYDFYEVDYGDGIIIQVPVNTFTPIHNYAVQGNYNVTVTGRYTTANNSCGTNTITFTPVNQVQPAQFNSMESLNATDLIIDYTLAPNTISSLEISLNSTSGFQKFKDLNQNTSRDTLRGLQLASNVYCFRIASDDACSNFSAYSNELCSINLQIQPVNNVNRLIWSTLYGTNYDFLEIYRDGALLNSIPDQVFTYNDSTVACSVAYCYRLMAYFTDGARVVSPEICATAVSTTPPEPVSNVSTTVQDNDLIWQWQVPSNESVANFIIRSDDGDFITQTTDTQFTDNFEDFTCINFEFINTCDNPSPISPTFCPFLIDASTSTDGSVTISWSDYNGWQNGVSEYIVVLYNQTMLIDSLSVGLSTNFTDPLPADNNQISFYRVYAIPIEAGVQPSASNRIKIERPPVISVPSSFTPNGDNLNDELVVAGKFIQSLQLDILNRWGNLIYSTTDNRWDGTSGGKRVAAGTYIYKVTVKDFIDKEHIRTGTVLILED